MESWLEARRAEGWQAEWSDLKVSGFPNRFDLTLVEPALADPGTGWSWQSAFVQVLSLSYRPNHVIVVLPEDHLIRTPVQRLSLFGEDMKASLVFEPGGDQVLERSSVVLTNLTVRSDQDWKSSLAAARFATRPVEGQPLTHEIGIELAGWEPAGPLVDWGTAAGLPAVVEGIDADVFVTFDAPWDRRALETARPQPTAIEVRDARASWGELSLRLAGELDVDASGRPTGALVVKAENWREILAAARASGMRPGIADALERALEVASGLTGRRDSLDIPLSFEDGRTYIGLLPLGPAPVLTLR